MIGQDNSVKEVPGVVKIRSIGFDRGDTEQRQIFWWVAVRIQSDQPEADGLMQRSLLGWRVETHGPWDLL